MQLDAHEPLDERRDALVGARDEERQDGRAGPCACRSSRQELEARTIGPLQAVDDDDERLLVRDAARRVRTPPMTSFLPVVRVLVVAAADLACPSRARRDARPCAPPRSPSRAGAEEAADDRARRPPRTTARPSSRSRRARDSRDGAERELAPHRRALDAQHARVGRQLGEERRDERGLADAHLADDDAAKRTSPVAGDRAVEGGVQIGLLGVAPDEIVRREGDARLAAPRA